MQKSGFLALVTVLFIFSAVQASVLWSQSSGSTDYFDWAGGQSLNGLYGDPIPIGNIFVFFPSLFRAECLDREINSISDTLEFELIAHPGYSFQSISIVEYGDYGILGTGTAQVSGSLSIENLETPNTLSSGIETDLPAIFQADSFGQWQAWAQIEFNPLEWNHIRVTLQNSLLAAGGVSSGAWIEKKVLENAIAVTIIPEPATLIIIASGIWFAGLERKKSKNK